MFKRNKLSEKVTTVIGSGSKLEGTLETEGILRIDGFVHGNIKTAGNIIVGKEGKINAEIEAANLIVLGEIIGNVHIKNILEIKKGGFLRGNISAAKIIVEEGSFFDGKCSMPDPEKKEKRERQKTE